MGQTPKKMAKLKNFSRKLVFILKSDASTACLMTFGFYVIRKQ